MVALTSQTFLQMKAPLIGAVPGKYAIYTRAAELQKQLLVSEPVT